MRRGSLTALYLRGDKGTWVQYGGGQYGLTLRCDPYCPPPYPCPLVPPQFYGPDLIAKSYVAASCAFLAWVHGVPTGRPIQDIGSYPCPMSPTSSTVLYCTRHLTAARETAVKSDEAHHATCRHQSVGTRYCCYRRGVNCSYMPYSFLPPATATNHLRQQVIPQATKLRAYLVLELLLLAVKQSRDTAA